jgi:succinoglycan exporter
MSLGLWSAVLQWARFGVNAAVFLIVARFLDLAEIGAFAAAFAPVRLVQVVHRAGIMDATVVAGPAEDRRTALFMLSMIGGVLAGLGFAAAGLAFGGVTGAYLLALSPLPLVAGLSAVAEGILRHDLRIRALALRTLTAQSVAAGAAFWALAAGWGAVSLVVFALVAGVLTGVISVAMAGWRPRKLAAGQSLWSAMRAELALVLRLSLRDLAANAPVPILQVAIAAVWGLSAAGAFQIAARMIALLDTLALAPLRYITLPRFSRTRADAIGRIAAESLRQSAGIGAFVYPGAALAAFEIAALAAGPVHAGTVAPYFAVLCLSGLTAALAMPFNQGLTATGQAALTLHRALWTLAASLALALPTILLSPVLAAAALPAGALLAFIPYVRKAMPLLSLSPALLLRALRVPALSSAFMCGALVLSGPLLPELSVIASLLAKVVLGGAVFALSFAIFGRSLRTTAPLA